MQYKLVWQAGIAGLIAIYPIAAQAATLNDIKGGIFVSQGAGYHAARTPVQLNAGDSVLANPGSSAKVVFGDGCTVAVQPGMVFTVPETSPCKAALPEDSVNWPLVAGGVLVAGGIGIAIAASSGGGGGGPASP